MPTRTDQKSAGAHRTAHRSSRQESKPQPPPWQLTQPLPANRLSDSGKKTPHRKNSLGTSSQTSMRSNHEAANATLHTTRASQPSLAGQSPEAAQKGYWLLAIGWDAFLSAT